MRFILFQNDDGHTDPSDDQDSTEFTATMFREAANGRGLTPRLHPERMKIIQPGVAVRRLRRVNHSAYFYTTLSGLHRIVETKTQGSAMHATLG
jgi:hypothetical protein